MGRAATHFEQVPKLVIEKILAQQETWTEKGREEDAAAKKPTARKLKCAATSREA
jgi:hypothetical protein